MPFDPSEYQDLDEVSLCLLKAAEIVRQGWCQNKLADERGGVCLVGALLKARGFGMDITLTADKTISKAYHRICGHLHNESVIGWNDTPGRTAEEVAQALERAALDG